ncbi:hypothetical protein ACIHDR_41545 [Nocardia sp. NPDC052278]|uniref:hypothetical protein n=1 Tax=unclassified Nocardia TaxID=2637762 RepID=UPI003676517E
MTNPWLDFLSDHYSSIWVLCWFAILVYWGRPLTESRCRCRCSTTTATEPGAR